MKDEEQANWEYKSDKDSLSSGDSDSLYKSSSSETKAQSAPDINWQAAEYVQHQRGIGWYIVLFLGTAALAAGVWFITKDVIAGAVIVLIGIIVAFYAGRKPGQLSYVLTNSGLSVGSRKYPYGQFKSFTVTRIGQQSSITLIPLKKFMPPISAFYPDNYEAQIVDLIGKYLPYEEHNADLIDRLSHILRF